MLSTPCQRIIALLLLFIHTLVSCDHRNAFIQEVTQPAHIGHLQAADSAAPTAPQPALTPLSDSLHQPQDLSAAWRLNQPQAVPPVSLLPAAPSNPVTLSQPTACQRLADSTLLYGRYTKPEPGQPVRASLPEQTALVALESSSCRMLPAEQGLRTTVPSNPPATSTPYVATIVNQDRPRFTAPFLQDSAKIQEYPVHPGVQPKPLTAKQEQPTPLSLSQTRSLHQAQQAARAKRTTQPKDSPVFTTQAGHHIQFTDSSCTQALITLNLPQPFQCQLQLPVKKQDPTLELADLVGQPSTWQARNLHIYLPEHGSPGKGCLYIGTDNKGLLGGSSGKGKGKCAYGEDARVWDKGLKRWVCPGPEKHPRKSPPRRDIPRNDPPKSVPPQPFFSRSVPPQSSFSRMGSDDWFRERERELNKRLQLRELEREALAKCSSVEDLVQAVERTYETAFGELHFDESQAALHSIQAGINRAIINKAIEAISGYESAIRREGFTPSELYSPDPISLLQDRYNYLAAKARASRIGECVVEIYQTSCDKLSFTRNLAEICELKAGIDKTIEAIRECEEEIRREGFTPSELYSPDPINLLQNKLDLLEKLSKTQLAGKEKEQLAQEMEQVGKAVEAIKTMLIKLKREPIAGVINQLKCHQAALSQKLFILDSLTGVPEALRVEKKLLTTKTLKLLDEIDQALQARTWKTKPKQKPVNPAGKEKEQLQKEFEQALKAVEATNANLIKALGAARAINLKIEPNISIASLRSQIKCHQEARQEALQKLSILREKAIEKGREQEEYERKARRQEEIKSREEIILRQYHGAEEMGNYAKGMLEKVNQVYQFLERKHTLLIDTALSKNKSLVKLLDVDESIAQHPFLKDVISKELTTLREEMIDLLTKLKYQYKASEALYFSPEDLYFGPNSFHFLQCYKREAADQLKGLAGAIKKTEGNLAILDKHFGDFLPEETIKRRKENIALMDRDKLFGCFVPQGPGWAIRKNNDGSYYSLSADELRTIRKLYLDYLSFKYDTLRSSYRSLIQEQGSQKASIHKLLTQQSLSQEKEQQAAAALYKSMEKLFKKLSSQYIETHDLYFGPGALKLFEEIAKPVNNINDHNHHEFSAYKQYPSYDIIEDMIADIVYTHKEGKDRSFGFDVFKYGKEKQGIFHFLRNYGTGIPRVTDQLEILDGAIKKTAKNLTRIRSLIAPIRSFEEIIQEETQKQAEKARKAEEAKKDRETRQASLDRLLQTIERIKNKPKLEQASKAVEGLEAQVNDHLQTCQENPEFTSLREDFLEIQENLAQDPGNEDLQERYQEQLANLQAHPLYKQTIELGMQAAGLRRDAARKGAEQSLYVLGGAEMKQYEKKQHAAAQQYEQAGKEIREVLVSLRAITNAPNTPPGIELFEAGTQGAWHNVLDTGKAVVDLAKFAINIGQASCSLIEKALQGELQLGERIQKLVGGLRQVTVNAKQSIKDFTSKAQHIWENPAAYAARLAALEAAADRQDLYDRAFDAAKYHLGAAKQGGYWTTEMLQLVYGGQVVEELVKCTLKGAKHASKLARTTISKQGIKAGKGKSVIRFEKGEGPGTWIITKEKMGPRASVYQSQITGKPAGWSYRVELGNGKGGVKFDGFKDGVLLDAKSRYSQFIDKKTGTWYKWFAKGKEGKSGVKSLIEQAGRQVEAAQGLSIEWHFEEEIVRDLVAKMLKEEKSPIKFIYTPYLPT